MNRQISESAQVFDRSAHSNSRQETGVATYILRAAIVTLVAAPTVHLRPHWGMLLTGSLWFAFWIYWNIAA